MKAFLMNADRDFDLKAPLPWNSEALVQDLELDTLFDAMAEGDEFLRGVARVALLTGGGNDLDTIRYRQAALQDCLQNPQEVRQIYGSVVSTIKGRQSRGGLMWLGNYPAAILSRSVELLEAQVAGLRELRHLSEVNAGRFRSPAFTTLFEMLQRELTDDYLHTVEGHLKELKFRDGVLVSAAFGKGLKAKEYVLRNALAEHRNWLQRLFGPKQEAYTFNLHPRDEAGARALSELRDRGINIAANAVAQSAEHILGFLTMLRTELAFYVGCLNAHGRLQAKQEPTAMPDPSKAQDRLYRFEGLYDVCLALRTEKRVVGNDLDADGKLLVIVTGANTGGKSTFLRSVGLAQVMMQAGIFAPARSFAANICDAVVTHFKREEDTAMNSGKFDEELSRMDEIVDHLTPNSLVLFNESFAATNEREGSEIAGMIVDSLLGHGIKSLYVTHLYEFAHGLVGRDREHIVFLRAERREDGTRTFRIVAGEPLRTSFGEDLYGRFFPGEPLDDDQAAA
ncbi:DNA mismatch repair protein MutS [Aquamicrobium terrae]